MWVASVIFYILTLILSLLGVQYHINIFKYPLYLTSSLTLAVFIPLSIIFLLPMDYIGYNNEDYWFSLPNKVILILWKTNYWTTFLLTWLILPFLQEYFKSGQLTKLNKIKESILVNLKYQAVMIGLFLICIMYLKFEVEGLNFTSLKLTIIALSHLYSLILATWLMGHGLISIPRNKWICGSNIKNLNLNYCKLPKILDEYEDIKMDLKDDILIIIKLHLNVDSYEFQYRDWIINLYNKIPQDLKEQVEKQYLHDNSSPWGNNDSETMNDSFIINLNSKFNKNLYKMNGIESDFNLTIKKILKLEDIMNSITTRELNFRIESDETNSKLNFVLWYYVNPYWNKISSILLWTVSFIILESEFFHSTRFSLIEVIIKNQSLENSPTLKFFITILLFSYILISSLNSLTKLKIFNIYKLVALKSDPISACWYTTYIARLTIPLSYNFLTLFINRQSNFEDWYGQSIHLTGLFNLLNNWLPRLILVPVLFAFFNVYEKLKHKFGIGNFYDSWIEFNDDEENGNELRRQDLLIVEAKRIVNRELSKRQLSLKPFNLVSRSEESDVNNAADLNYNRNQQLFNDELMNRSRVSFDNEEDTYYNGVISPENNNNNTWNNFKTAIGGFFNSGGNKYTGIARPYRDEEALDQFNYDDDANENLIL